MADRYQEEMRLVARINDWHERLEPILAVQEGRQGFDIQECAAELLDNIRHTQSERKHEPQQQQQENVEFASMVRGKEPWEVCRFFLSSLLLVNCGNIQVASKDPLEFHVNSTRPCFDAANTFQAMQEQQQQEQQEHQKRKQSHEDLQDAEERAAQPAKKKAHRTK